MNAIREHEQKPKVHHSWVARSYRGYSMKTMSETHNKDYSKGAAAYFLIAAILDSILCFAFAAFFFILYGKENNLSIAASLSVTFGLIMAISITGYIRTIHGKKVVAISLLMKLTVFLYGAGCSFLAIEEGIYAFGLFICLGTMLAIMVIAVPRGIKRTTSTVGAAASLREPFLFRADWEWEPAAKEYVRLRGLQNLDHLTDAQNNEIYTYAVGPFSYFFYWLALSGKLSNDFCKEFPTPDFTEQMRSHRLTPVDALNQIDAYIDAEDILQEIHPFIRHYYDVRFFDLEKNIYLYDYYDVLGAFSDRFYCIDFTWEYAEKLFQRIQAAYENWAAECAKEFYPEYGIQALCKRYSTHYEQELEVYPTGERRNGFPGGPEAYAERCVQCLDVLNAAQWQRLERLVRETYDYAGIGTEHPLEKFYPLYLYIAEPKNADDLVFYVSGDAGFEEEDGFSFTVRNGIIVECGLSYDFEDPYSVSCERKYRQMLDNIDYHKVRSEEDAAHLVAAGKLVKVPLLPGIPGCLSEERRETVYMTPAAAEIKEHAEKNLRYVMSFCGEHKPETKYILHHGNAAVDAPPPLVPKSVTISNANRNEAYKYGCTIPIWD